jgi:hypothetical protein
MRNSRRHRTRNIDSLRLTIECLPVNTREAMLEAVTSGERIIVGAYVDGHGGACPMLAAHRRGGRTDFLAFAKSWDRFTAARGRARPATPRELSILASLLERSLGTDAGLDLAGVIAEHHELSSRSSARRAETLRGILTLADPPGEVLARRLASPATVGA